MIKSLHVYLVTDGNGREAVAFYEKVFNARVLGIQTFGEGPSDPNHPLPEEAKNRVMHASLEIGESLLMLSDTFPGMPHQKGNHVTVSVNAESAEEAEEIFCKLADGGEVLMPFQKTFWSEAYGMVTDKFGVTFHVNCDVAARATGLSTLNQTAFLRAAWRY